MEKPDIMDRDWEFVGFPEQIGELLSRTLKDVPLYLKGADACARFDSAGRENGVFLFHYPGNIEFSERVITLYATLNRQLEIDFEIREFRGANDLMLTPLRARIGKRTRNFPRYKTGCEPGSGDFVQAANFQLHRPAGVQASGGSTPVAQRILLREFERTAAGDFPGLRIFDHGDRERPLETDLLNKGGAIFVSDTLRPDCFASIGPGFLDYRAALDDQDAFVSRMRRYRDERIRSLAVLAVPHPAHPRGRPMAFIHYGRRDHVMEAEECERLRSLAGEISRSLSAVHTVQVMEKQGIVNISEGGVALKITRPEIVDCLRTRENVNFDLLFRMQAPMRFQGRVAHMKEMGDHVVLGIGFEGTAASATRTDNKERLRALLRMGLEQALLEAC